MKLSDHIPIYSSNINVFDIVHLGNLDCPTRNGYYYGVEERRVFNPSYNPDNAKQVPTNKNLLSQRVFIL